MSLSDSGPTIAIKLTADASEAESTLDQFTSQAQSAGNQAADSFDSADQAAGDLGPAVQTSTAQMSSGLGAATADTQSYGLSWDQAGVGVFRAARTITAGFGGLLSAESGIYDAQQRVNVANIQYILTTREYGAGSIQAARALDQLQVAQSGVTVANQQLTVRMVQFGLSVAPTVYEAMSKLIAASLGMTLENYREGASWYFKAGAIAATAVALAAVTFGISALVGGLAATQVASTVGNSANQYTANTTNIGGSSAQYNVYNTNVSQSNSFGATPAASAQSIATTSLKSLTR